MKIFRYLGQFLGVKVEGSTGNLCCRSLLSSIAWFLRHEQWKWVGGHLQKQLQQHTGTPKVQDEPKGIRKKDAEER